KFLRRTYDTPKHPWEAARMEEERRLVGKYGLKNKRELWKAQSILRGFRRQARELQARVRAGEGQAKRETDGLLGRLTRLGVLPAGSASLDDVLALNAEVVLERRFEWVAFRREFAPTPKGARQLIVHGHLTIGAHKVTRPGYLVLAAEETDIAYAPSSGLLSDEHPVRVAIREKLARRNPDAPAAPPAAAPGGA
ncbi:MAG TPA: 30S ribosomal protein S4, partial [Thermoplasmata archaeon]|nr:30S ribosomal protein S4 [Thermoplasmata archaeon]